MRCKIVFDHFINPAGADLAGRDPMHFLAFDGYFLEDEYATRQAAEYYLSVSLMGPDSDGVDAVFAIEEV